MEQIKLSLLVNGNGIVENFKKNSIHFANIYNKSYDDFKQISIKNILPGKFYFFHYQDTSNWMKYAPVFIADFKQFKNRSIIFAINMNFIPLEVRAMIFDKFITEKMFERDEALKVDFQGVYNELRKTGFEYALNEFDANRISLVHQVSMNLLPRFLYHQHPLNKYDPKKLIQIWTKKLETREQRHNEMTMAVLSEFYDVNKDISSKFDVLKGHIDRLRKNDKKFG